MHAIGHVLGSTLHQRFASRFAAIDLIREDVAGDDDLWWYLEDDNYIIQDVKLLHRLLPRITFHSSFQNAVQISFSFSAHISLPKERRNVSIQSQECAL